MHPGRFSLRWLLVGIVAALWLSACGGGSSGSNTSAVASSSGSQASALSRPVSQSDYSIATLIYTDTQRTPVGFFTENAPIFSGYVATSHLKNTDLNADPSTQYELCSDDFNQALQWSETANTNSGDGASLVGTDSTDRYFEFDRVRSGTPQGYLRARIYKCDYIDRSDVDLRLAQGMAGVLNTRPLDSNSLQAFVEYAWQFTRYNNFGNVVLSSIGTSNSLSLTHSLIIANLNAGNDANVCDTIDVVEWKHSLDMSSGALTLTVTPLWSFRAKQTLDAIALCTE